MSFVTAYSRFRSGWGYLILLSLIVGIWLLVHYTFGVDAGLALLLLFLSIEASVAIAVANADLLATQEMARRQEELGREQREQMLKLMTAIKTMIEHQLSANRCKEKKA